MDVVEYMMEFNLIKPLYDFCVERQYNMCAKILDDGEFWILESYNGEKVWKEIPVDDFLNRQRKGELFEINDKEKNLLLGLEGNEDRGFHKYLSGNCYYCCGRGIQLNGEDCNGCSGVGHSREIKLYKTSDNYYIIYYWKHDTITNIAFEIDGFNNLKNYWRAIYLKFMGRKVPDNVSKLVDKEFMIKSKI
jgi:hypothetical protein